MKRQTNLLGRKSQRFGSLLDPVEIFVRFGFRLYCWALRLWQVHVRRLHRKILESKTGLLPEMTRPKKVAIVAVYPSPESLPFTINLLQGLIKNDCFVVIVSTGSEQYTPALLKYCHTYCRRAPVGRDFGSYKLGLELSRALLKEAEHLVLANDSLYYPENFKERISELLDVKEEWAGLFECYEYHYHAQSFFQVFRKSLYLSEVFQNFWKKYTPYSDRFHVINRGEVRFSKVLKKAHKFPFILYSTYRLAESLSASLQRDEGKALPSILSMTLPEYGEFAFPALTPSKEVLETTLVYAVTARAELKNPTHSLAILANYLLGAPLKRDLAYRGVLQVGEVVYWASGFSEEERRLIERDMRQKGLPASFGFAKRTLVRSGFL